MTMGIGSGGECFSVKYGMRIGRRLKETRYLRYPDVECCYVT